MLNWILIGIAVAIFREFVYGIHPNKFDYGSILGYIVGTLIVIIGWPYFLIRMIIFFIFKY